MAHWDDAERVRERLAHRLHDGPIQELTAAQLFLDGLALRMDAQPGVDPAVRQSLQRGLEALRNATLGCRRLMDSLRPGLEGEGELAGRVQRAVEEVAPEAVTVVDVPSEFGARSPDAALAVYRVVEELLDHLRERRALPRRVEAVVHGASAQISVSVGGGAAFEPASASLRHVSERLAALGGALQLADGDRVALVRLPLETAAEVP